MKHEQYQRKLARDRWRRVGSVHISYSPALRPGWQRPVMLRVVKCYCGCNEDWVQTSTGKDIELKHAILMARALIKNQKICQIIANYLVIASIDGKWLNVGCDRLPMATAMRFADKLIALDNKNNSTAELRKFRRSITKKTK